MCAKVYAFCCFGGFQRGPAFIEELLSVIPNAQYYKRGTYDLKKVPFLSFISICFSLFQCNKHGVQTVNICNLFPCCRL